MTPHIEKETCLKEKEWREVHDFIAATPAYRTNLDSSIKGIQRGMWAVALSVLIPFVLGLVWVGELKNTVAQHTNDIRELQQDFKEFKKR